MEADLLRCYGVDLLDLWRRCPDTGRPALTLRRLRVLVKHLPSDSATGFHLWGPIARWGPVEHILADIWEATRNRGAKRQDRKMYPRPTRAIPASQQKARRNSRREKLRRQRRRYLSQAGP